MPRTDDLSTPAAKAEAVRLYAAQTNGSENMHRGLCGLRFTDGVRFVAETCEAFWLVDAIASYQGRLRGEDFQLWRIARENVSPDSEPTTGWVLTCWNDTPEARGSRCLVCQPIPYSDFPPDLSPFKLYVENGTCLLPEER